MARNQKAPEGIASRVVAGLRSAVAQLKRADSLFDANAEWRNATKRTIARYSRGNIAAQDGRILTRQEWQDMHDRAVKIAQVWRDRAALESKP